MGSTKMRGLLITGLRAWRSIAGENTALERTFRRSFNRVKKEEGPGWEQYAGQRFVYTKSTVRPGPTVAIYMKGSCDLTSMFAAAPIIRERLSGSCCIFYHPGGISAARPDILLQALRGVPDPLVRDLFAPTRKGALSSRTNDKEESNGQPRGRLRLQPDYFKPRLFEPTFTIPELPGFGPFPKTVVVLSANPAITRTVYRHRTHGYLVDPGGFWLTESMDQVMANLSTASWFKDNFQSIGKMSLDTFEETFRELVLLVKERTGARVLVYNSLLVDPGNPTHNYQFARHAQTVRRREFDLRLRELSRELDFHIVDVDRILKMAGVEAQVDFAHFPPERMRPIAEEVCRILEEMKVL